MYSNYGTIEFNNELIQDITKRYVLLSESTSTGNSIFIDYIIKEWKSPENIAYDLYGSCDYVWVILLCNNIINPFEDWLRTAEELDEYIKNKYGDKADEIHHYEADGVLYWTRVPGAQAITNSQYEYDRNEKKRKIKVAVPEVISRIEEMLRQIK